METLRENHAKNSPKLTRMSWRDAATAVGLGSTLCVTWGFEGLAGGSSAFGLALGSAFADMDEKDRVEREDVFRDINSPPCDSYL